MANPFAAASLLENSAGVLQLLADASLKATVVLAAAGLLALLNRRSSANIRRLVWAVALIGGISIPVVTALLPGWSVPLLPALETAMPVAASEGPARHASRSLQAHAAEEEALHREAAAGALSDPETQAQLLAADNQVGNGMGVGRWLTWALLVWLAGVAVSLVHQLTGLWQLRRWSAGALPLRSSRWRRLLAETSAAVRPGRRVLLLASPKVPLPMTWGLLRPVVLLPASSAGWSDERARIVLQHELLHIRRGDWLLLSAARWACTLYWFHPLAWFALRRLATEQELACDDAVLSLGTTPSTYATHLLEIARSLRATRPAIALEMARRSSMEGRLMALLDPERTRRLSLAALPLVILMISLVPAIASIHPWTASQPLQAVVAAANTGDQELAASLREAIAEMRQLEMELEPYTKQLRSIEAEMGPVHERMREIEVEMRNETEFLRQEEIAMQPHRESMAELERMMRPYQERLEAIARQMEPIKEQLEAVHDELVPDHERLESLHQSLEPYLKEMEEVHREMEQHFESMEEVHREVEQHHQHLESLHQQLEPYHQRLEQAAAEMEPYHQRMEEVHREMEHHHERMEQIHHRFQLALSREIESVLRAELEHAVTDDAPFAKAVEAITHRISIHITDDDRLEIDTSARSITRALHRSLGSSRASGITDGELEAAFERAAEAVINIGDNL